VANLPADLELQARLHRYGLAEWVRRNNRDEMLRVAQGCVDALDKIQALEREIERLRNDIQELTCGDPRKVCPNCRDAAETKATLPHGFTGLQAFDAYEWLRGVCEKEPDNDHAHVALGLWHHHATGGPVETPDELATIAEEIRNTAKSYLGNFGLGDHCAIKRELLGRMCDVLNRRAEKAGG
jgi:hypothetical protein